MQQQVHLAKQIRQRFRLNAVKRAFLQVQEVFRPLALFLEMFESFHQESPGTGRRIKNSLSKHGIDNRDDELHQRAGCVKLS